MTERKYNEALCELTAASMRHADKLIRTIGTVETLCILSGNVKSLLALVRKKVVNCSACLLSAVIFATQNGGVVSVHYPIHICFTQ